MENIIVKIITVLLIIILILILLKYLDMLHKKNQNNSSVTEPDIKEGNTLIMTKIEEFEQNQPVITQCPSAPKLQYLYLSNEQLKRKYKPEPPIWPTNIFCVYKLNRVLSLNDNLPTENAKDEDYYYSLGDIILLKDYPKYLQDYNDNSTKYLKSSQQCVNPFNSEESITTPPQESITTHPQESLVPSEKITGEVTNNNLPSDNYISNYDQPGLKGLKMLIKGGKKPIGFDSKPVCTLSKSNGLNLYIWRPIAPEGYVFLGQVCSIGVNPTVPQIDTCQIRALPLECLTNIPIGNRDILLSAAIPFPYRIYFTSEGKYFKAMISTGEEETHSQDLVDKCLEIERGSNEKTLVINMINSDGKGGKPERSLEAYEFNSFKLDFSIQLEKKLLEIPELKLNNFTNNKEIEPNMFREENKRYTIDTKSLIKDSIIVKITFKDAALAYDELITKNLLEKIENIYKDEFNFSLRVNGKDYNFESTKFEVEREETKNDLEDKARDMVGLATGTDASGVNLGQCLRKEDLPKMI